MADTTRTRLTLDKPFDLKGEPTAAKMAQIDEMLEELYRVTAASANPTQWPSGPWTLDGVKPTKNIAGIRPWDPIAGTYNDYAPEGIDTCVTIEVDPQGAVVITGIKQYARIRRFIGFINRSTTNSITFKHENTGSKARYRLRLPNSEDVVVGPGQAFWAYYAIGSETEQERWQLFITPHTSGGLAMGGLVVVHRSLTKDELEAMTTTLGVDIVVAPGAGKILVPVSFSGKIVVTQPYANSPQIVLRHEAQTVVLATLAGYSWTSIGSGFDTFEGGHVAYDYSSTNPENKALRVCLSAVLTQIASPDSSATATVSCVYYTMTV